VDDLLFLSFHPQIELPISFYGCDFLEEFSEDDMTEPITIEKHVIFLISKIRDQLFFHGILMKVFISNPYTKGEMLFDNEIINSHFFYFFLEIRW
jgi:hypothetical protein